MAVRWNAARVQDDVHASARTPGGDAEDSAPGPFLLQDRLQRVRCRELRIEPLP